MFTVFPTVRSGSCVAMFSYMYVELCFKVTITWEIAYYFISICSDSENT